MLVQVAASVVERATWRKCVCWVVREAFVGKAVGRKALMGLANLDERKKKEPKTEIMRTNKEKNLETEED